MRYRTKKKIKYALIILVPLLLGFLTFQGITTLTGKTVKEIRETTNIEQGLVTLEENPLNVEGYTEIKVETVPGGILLKANCTGVFIAMSNLKSFSIQRGIANELDIRPNYHDLTYDLIEHYGGKVVLAKIGRMKTNFYYADLYIEAGNDLLHLDSRPSDALGIASRFKAPMYIKNNLLEKQGQDICNF
tara:strand:+ start:527 stop:1093 length:567 start_codon:yes stop_codon:yes gene_type:complete